VNSPEHSGATPGGRVRFRDLPNDSTAKILVVATLVCIVCAVLVSSAAVLLRPIQERNALLARQRYILEVAGLPLGPGQAVEQAFGQVEPHLVELDSGEYLESGDAIGFDIAKASREPGTSRALGPDEDLAKIHRRPDAMPVFLVRGDQGIETVVLPVHGYGLWSTMYGYVALDGRGEQVKGITFYSHGETPGLGAEIENPGWQSQWPGKRTLGEDGSVLLSVSKGSPSPEQADYHIDAISGATLTSDGVDNMIQFWLGAQGFGPYLARLRSGGG
jgi:Na+-transporting NADH:ubiquinone oxidoreductase subunit C